MTVYLDANIVIYLVEADPTWGARALTRVAVLQAAGESIAVSDIHRLECLVGPFILGDVAAQAAYAACFADPAIQVLSVTGGAFERAARIRAIHNFKPLDALHLAVAVEQGCGLFLTNDAQLARFPDLSVELLT
jgi:predicted nucleic acid-binding protein